MDMGYLLLHELLFHLPPTVSSVTLTAITFLWCYFREMRSKKREGPESEVQKAFMMLMFQSSISAWLYKCIYIMDSEDFCFRKQFVLGLERF